MILIVGGAASGKRTYALSLGYSDDQLADGKLDERPVICNAHLIIADALDAAGDTAPTADAPAFLAQIIDQLAEQEVVTCDEMGGGVIPLTARDRKLREAVGYACNELARRADTVIRMVCGIPLILKESDVS